MSDINTHPLISIGITCFNAVDTIGRAIDSALKQDWPNTEIIVVDDVSSDGSQDVIKSYIDKGVRIVVHDNNTGPGGARNTLLKEAKGEFLVYFDDDDESFPERLSHQYKDIESFENEYPNKLCACYASGERLYPNGHKVSLEAIGQEPVYPNGAKVAGRVLFYGPIEHDWFYGITPSCALMARTSTFRTIGGFDPTFRRVEDIDFVVRLALYKGYFIGTKKKLFRQYATDAIDKSYEKNLQAEQKLVSKHKAYLKKTSYYNHAYLWPVLRFYHFKRQYGRFFLTLMKLLARNPVHTIRHIMQTGPKRLQHEAHISR